MTDKVKSELAEQQFFLQIPLDASSIEDRLPNQVVKVVVQGQSRDGQTMEQVVKFDQKGMGTAEFTFKENPGQLRVAIGPQDASAEDVMGLQTVAFNISPRQWLEPKLALSPVRILPVLLVLVAALVSTDGYSRTGSVSGWFTGAGRKGLRLRR
jgi:hypothetical protein